MSTKSGERPVDDRAVALAAGENAFANKQHRTWRQLVWQRFRRHHLAMAATANLSLLLILAMLGPFFIDRDHAYRPNPRIMNQAPSRTHIMGTDEVGRDIAARVIYAGRISLSIGLVAVAISISIGTSIGALAGFFGGWTDTILMRFTDLMLSIPTIFLLIALAVFLGPSVRTIIIVLGLLSWMPLARIVRANFLSLREKEFVEAARCIGASNTSLIFRHMLPNTMAPIVVGATLGVGTAMLTETAVSYLGLGVQPPTPSWGNMLYNAQSQMWNAPWISVFPGLMILITVLSMNFVGDGLRDALDPRAK